MLPPLPFPPLYPRVLFMGAGVIALCSCDGAEMAIDQADRWYDPNASHHSKHAIGGAVLGAIGYECAGLLTDESDKRIAIGTAGGFAAGVAFELARGRDGSAYIDPVDMLWTGVGALVGSYVTSWTHETVALALSPRGVSVSLAWRF